MTGRMSSERVLQELTELKIPHPPLTMYKQLWEELKASNESFFRSPPQTLPDEDWLEDEGIADMYALRFERSASNRISKKIQGCQGALNMLQDPNLKKYNYVLSFMGMEQVDVELIINARYSIAHDTPDFAAFFHYFCNFDEWTYTDKELYMDSSPEGIKSVLKLALKNDRSFLIWKLGLGTDPNLKYDDMLKDMLTDSYFLFKENIKLMKADEANKFAVLATKLADRLDGLNDEKDKDNDLLSKLKFKLEISTTQKDDSAIKSMTDIQLDIPTLDVPVSIDNLNAMMNK
jgi:hypothetical protein